MAVAAMMLAATGLLGAGLRVTPPMQLQRAGGPLMMPSTTPKVPYKYPGMEDPVWIDVYNRMYRERIMFLNQEIDDNFANTIIAVLLYLESENANDNVAMYYNVPGGVTKSGLAIYDTMRIMPYSIQTVNIGMCAQIGAFLVGGGTPGKRFALPNSRFMMQNPRIDPRYDENGRPMFRPMQATEMKLEVEEVIRDKKLLLEGFSRFTGRSIDLLRADFGRDFYLTAVEASQYGLVDQILMPKNPSKAKTKADIKLGNFGGDGQRYGDQLFGKTPDAPPPPAPGDREPPPGIG
jgi:ATP-dependent Clp protease protease subunit